MTGATAGLGRAIAAGLASRGASVIMLCRDAERGEAARSTISRESGTPDIHVVLADLSSLSSVRLAAEAIRTAHARVDVLVNNAGVFTRARRTTPEGLEVMFATNHLGPFLLTSLLLERVQQSDDGRILTVTAPSTVPVDFDDLQSERRFNALRVFGATKMCNLLFTYELARRLAGTTVTANAVHPGVVRSTLMREAPVPIRWLTYLSGAPPANAAAPIVDLALDERHPALQGAFLHRTRQIRSNDFSRDPANQRRLWELSERLVAETG